jgi:hypothetical protein
MLGIVNATLVTVPVPTPPPDAVNTPEVKLSPLPMVID